MIESRDVTETPSTPVSVQPVAAPECRNCGAAAPGAYCPHCGQETTLALPTVRSMLREAAGRYVAFDGRMWRTLIGLLFRPGFLTREYFAGRRRRYIRPARLFLVLSIALFALLRFEGEPPQIAPAQPGEAKQDKLTPKGAEPGHRRLSFGSDEDVQVGGTKLDQIGGGRWLDPVRQRAELFNHLSPQAKAEQISTGMLRYGPYAMFVLLPLFALLMKLVYLGRTSQYPGRSSRYAAHLVFGAHSHAFLFLMIALMVLLTDGALRAALVVWTIVYLLLSMRTVYGGRWSGIVLRAAVIFVLYFVFFLVVVAALLIAAILVR